MSTTRTLKDFLKQLDANVRATYGHGIGKAVPQLTANELGINLDTAAVVDVAHVQAAQTATTHAPTAAPAPAAAPTPAAAPAPVAAVASPTVGAVAATPTVSPKS